MNDALPSLPDTDGEVGAGLSLKEWYYNQEMVAVPQVREESPAKEGYEVNDCQLSHS